MTHCSEWWQWREKMDFSSSNPHLRLRILELGFSSSLARCMQSSPVLLSSVFLPENFLNFHPFKCTWSHLYGTWNRLQTAPVPTIPSFPVHFLIWCVYVNKHVDASFLINYPPFIVRTLPSPPISLAYFHISTIQSVCARSCWLPCSVWAINVADRKAPEANPLFSRDCVTLYLLQSLLVSVSFVSPWFGKYRLGTQERDACLD